MSVQITIPYNQSFPQLTNNVFSATFNATTPGAYDWGIPANAEIPIQANGEDLIIDPHSVYIIERLNFSVNVPEEDFNDVQIPGESLNIQLFYESSKQPVFLNTQPLINYVDNLELFQPLKSAQEEDKLLATVTGQLGQNFNLAGKLQADVFIQFIIYRVQSTDWVRKYIDQKLGLGDNMLLAGSR